jgi:acyl-CoA synthetase (AMP-forming)/AMP-acid ligase II
MLTNAGQLLTERARISGNLEALVDVETGARLSYRDLNESVNRIAHHLRTVVGVSTGRRVGILMPNSAAFIAVYFALAKIGAISVMLNWRLTPGELAFQLTDSGTSSVIFGESQAELIQPLVGDLPAILWIAANETPTELATAIRSSNETATIDEPEIGAAGDDGHFIMYTSGTTGRPKGALHTHRSTLTWSHASVSTTEMRLGDRALIVAPMFHIGGLAGMIMYVERGVIILVSRRFDPVAIWRLIATERINHMFLAPTMLNAMLPHAPAQSETATSLRWFMVGAAPVPVTLIEHYAALNIDIHQVYGSTETHGGICLLPADRARSKAGSTGLPYFGIDVRVVDADGRSVPAGVPGEVVTRGAHVIRKYWNHGFPATDAEGWFHTGDIAEVDDLGFIYIKDRLKDLIISGGENIYPAEVENALRSHASVLDVAVIGQASEKWGESPAAIVVLKPDYADSAGDALKSAILLAGRQTLAAYKMPHFMTFIDELPQNASGKVLKNLLRDRYPGPAPE